MHIKYLFVNNYKTFVNFKVEFFRNGLLLGKNGVGKSNVFVVIDGLCSFVRSNALVAGTVFSASTMTRWLKSNIQIFELCMEDEQAEYVYHLELEHSYDNENTRVKIEKVTVDGNVVLNVEEGRAAIDGGKLEMLVNQTLSAVISASLNTKNKNLEKFWNAITKIVYCSPNPKNMFDKVENDIYWPSSPEFPNIATAYFNMILVNPEMQNNIVDTLREINSSFRNIRLSIEQYGKYMVFDYKHKDVLCSYRFSELSDGEKMLFALYVLLYGYICAGYVVLLDEPDNYISLKEIKPWCMELEDKIDDGQCLLISHNPEVINFMADINGIWLNRLSSGETEIIPNPLKDVVASNLLPYSELIARGLDEK